MIVAVPQSALRRWPVTTGMFADLTAKEVISLGWAEVDGGSVFQVQFAVNLTQAETDAVTRRLTTRDAVEETLYANGVAALDTDRVFRDTTSDDIVTGADAIINDASITSTEVPGYLKDLARGVKALANFNDSLARQNIALIRLAQNLLDAAD